MPPDAPPGVSFLDLSAGGDAGSRIRAKDWAATALGPRDSWPRSLHNHLSMIFELPGAAIIFWGPEQIQLYNDGYAVIMGPRHPRYFGARYFGPGAAAPAAQAGRLRRGGAPSREAREFWEARRREQAAKPATAARPTAGRRPVPSDGQAAGTATVLPMPWVAQALRELEQARAAIDADDEEVLLLIA